MAYISNALLKYQSSGNDIISTKNKILSISEIERNDNCVIFLSNSSMNKQVNYPKCVLGRDIYIKILNLPYNLFYLKWYWISAKILLKNVKSFHRFFQVLNVKKLKELQWSNPFWNHKVFMKKLCFNMICNFNYWLINNNGFVNNRKKRKSLLFVLYWDRS